MAIHVYRAAAAFAACFLALAVQAVGIEADQIVTEEGKFVETSRVSHDDQGRFRHDLDAYTIIIDPVANIVYHIDTAKGHYNKLPFETPNIARPSKEEGKLLAKVKSDCNGIVCQCEIREFEGRWLFTRHRARIEECETVEFGFPLRVRTVTESIGKGKHTIELQGIVRLSQTELAQRFSLDPSWQEVSEALQSVRVMLTEERPGDSPIKETPPTR